MIDDLKHLPRVRRRHGVALVGFLSLCLCVAGSIDYAAALTDEQRLRALVLKDPILAPAMHPATMEECERALPDRGRPIWTVSYQHRTGQPWHRRYCGWRQT